MEQEKLLQKLATILEKLKIPYFITGGIATVIWGRPRFTADIDVVIQLVPQKLDKLAQELLKIDKNVYLSKESMTEAMKRQGEFNFIHPASGLKIDFWILKNTPFDETCLKRRVKKTINKQKVFFISSEDLILNKLLWRRKSESTRQLEDVESILKISKVDLKYLKRWAKLLEVSQILNKLTKSL